ncbi:hypothetical protein SprV_0200824000 [Sparganum proliferum]
MVTLRTALILLVVLVLSDRQECAKPATLDDALLPSEEELLEEELKEASSSSVDPLPGHSDLAPAGFSLRRFLRRVERGIRRIFRIRRCRGEECLRHRSRFPRYNPYIFERRLD